MISRIKNKLMRDGFFSLAIALVKYPFQYHKRIAYRNILGDTGATINSNNAQAFQPQVGMDTANGTLPAGEVDMSQIAGLMGSK